MSFPKYPAYKDSGIKWVGDIPVGWNIVRLKETADCNSDVWPEDTPEDTIINYIEISDVDEYRGIKNWHELSFSSAPSRARRKVVLGDVIISTVRTYLKAIAQIVFTKNNLTVSTGFAVFRAKSIEANYLSHALHCDFFLSEVISRSVGVSYPAINSSEIANLFIPFPPLPEQQAIASFLDRECGKIDALIAEQERLIALLAEKRQAVISHAVTKGLNPNVPMKDSGIPWIGMVPEGWEVVRFSRLVAISEGQVDPRNEQYASMILVAPNHIEAGTGHLREMITASDQNAESGKYLYKAGAVLYSKIRPSLAKVVIAPVSGLCSADMYPLTSRGSLSHLYLAWLMLSPGFTAWTVMESDRVAMPKINREKLNEAMLPLPPLSEQLEISEYIKNEIINFDTTMNITRTAIILLKERRAALISAAVTGKIDVRAQSKALAA